MGGDMGCGFGAAAGCDAGCCFPGGTAGVVIPFEGEKAPGVFLRLVTASTDEDCCGCGADSAAACERACASRALLLRIRSIIKSS